ncbi:MAG: transporter substrate-binding domain-containing protein [Desulfobulbus sp.]|jgi:signal transduction histidine kinase/CheY-like chemotaxis protein|uniref:response regulator n=1 Tax=Desulfobulbus sp. TaxID=895 RepID=UPI0028468BD9|nr:transporter substrate-binding domain-containing protein [Desulfobulbus sp.]MDR2551262.1 transporter substrate-binding domain-containing protein [Desulfobulbus sp.]
MRITHILLSIILIFLLGSCNTEQRISKKTYISYETYRDIPGVTEHEIASIEAIKKNKKEFVYGVNRTTESFIGENNQVEGFSKLLCDRFSYLFGIRFSPRMYGWDDLNVKLKENEIDFTGELSPNPERAKMYHMTSPMIQRTIKIFTNRNSDKIFVISKERPIKAAFLIGSTTYDMVKMSWNYQFEPIFVSNENEAIDLLKNNSIDCYIDESSVESMFDEHDFTKTENYFPITYSPLSVTTNNQELEPFIAVIQKYLDTDGLYDISALNKQGAEDYLRYKIKKFLTDEEKKYIEQHRTTATAVPVGFENDNYPISFYNEKDEAFQGIAMDVLQEVSRLTGLQFRIVNSPDTPWEELLAQLDKGDVALVSELLRSKGRQGRFLWLNEPNCTDNYALLSRSDFPDADINEIMNLDVGMVKESAHAELFHEWFPEGMRSRSYLTYYDAFLALERGEIDLLMGTQNLLLSLTNYLEKPGFKANIVFQYPSYSEFGLNKNELVLQSILNKAQRSIDLDATAERWKRKVFDYNSKLLKDVMPYMLAALVLLVLGFSSVFFLLVKNRRMSKNLETIVAVRTRELEQASRAKSDFLSRMSHEMRTPMNAIIGMGKIAEHSEDMSKLRYCLDAIGASASHLLGLINDILDMSKIEAGKFELGDGPLNLEEMLIKICNLIVDRTEQKQQRLRVRLGRNLHRNYTGDELRLSQVITNLLANAVKFTPDCGEISLSVTESLRKGDCSILRFTVSDTGIGMTPEQISRLFNPFEQADTSIAARFGGTGLAISKTIVEKMRGRMWVESQPENGSTFFFEAELERRPARTPLLFANGIQPVNMRLFAASGDEETRALFRTVAETLGIGDCRTAATGDTAARLLDEAHVAGQPYDAVFIDAQLPDMSCLELLRRVQGRVRPETVTMTAPFSAWSGMEQAAAELDLHRFLAVPLFPTLIARAIRETVEGGEHAIVPAERQPDTAVPDFSGVILLLAEDVALNREIFIALLEQTGIHIDTAVNGLEATQMFERQPERYDLIVMDLQMPVMDGYEATRTIRDMEHPRAKTIPIIAMTANVFKEDIDKCLASGMNDHMPKPIDEQVVLEKISLALQRVSAA